MEKQLDEAEFLELIWEVARKYKKEKNSGRSPRIGDVLGDTLVRVCDIWYRVHPLEHVYLELFEEYCKEVPDSLFITWKASFLYKSYLETFEAVAAA